MSKICTICGEKKELDKFSTDRSKKDGKRPDCKKCCNKRTTEWANKNKNKVTDYAKQYREKHKENIEKYHIEYRQHNKEKIKKYHQLYFQNNKEKITARNKERRKNDILYRLSCILRERLNKVITKQYKRGSSIADLGCSLEDLRIHIENKFVDGMSWENYGEWHIDHIIPLCKFNLKIREQFLKACNYKNLQPLWAKDNLSKGGY